MSTIPWTSSIGFSDVTPHCVISDVIQWRTSRGWWTSHYTVLHQTSLYIYIYIERESDVTVYSVMSTIPWTSFTGLSDVTPYSVMPEVSPHSVMSDVTPYSVLFEVSPYSVMSDVLPYSVMSDVTPYSVMSDGLRYCVMSDVTPYSVMSDDV